MTKEKLDLQGLAAELDNTVGGINLATETMDDISVGLLHVVEEMDNIKNMENLRLHFEDWHRELRILAKLMHHASNDLVAGNEEAKALSEQIFEKVVRQGKSHERYA